MKDRIHKFEQNGTYILLDVNSGAVHVIDKMTYDLMDTFDGINAVTVNGQELGLGGYLDIGLYDTMEDLFVNFIGALVFSVIGYFSAKKESMRKFADNFVPRLREDETDGKDEIQQ